MSIEKEAVRQRQRDRERERERATEGWNEMRESVKDSRARESKLCT